MLGSERELRSNAMVTVIQMHVIWYKYHIGCDIDSLVYTIILLHACTMCMYLHYLVQENVDQEALHCAHEMLLIRENTVAPSEQEHQQCLRRVTWFQD